MYCIAVSKQSVIISAHRWNRARMVWCKGEIMAQTVYVCVLFFRSFTLR
uniref:Uncharacterized protein n=1 Tax=Zea mays TaxID=4577 RepID=B4FJG5_MAIZE|nr:unknown [Zea mays]